MGRRRLSGDVRLERLAERFARWRASRSPRSRISPALWSAAAKLAAELGVSRTARALGVSYYSLDGHCQREKRRVAERAAKSSTTVAKQPLFVELPATQRTSRECVIELEHSDGSRMRIHLKGELPDVASLVDDFWGER